jgi:hypothetical protein
VDLNEFAKEITLIEGKKQSISIAQVKEVIKILGDRWRDMVEPDAIIEFQMIREGAL